MLGGFALENAIACDDELFDQAFGYGELAILSQSVGIGTRYSLAELERFPRRELPWCWVWLDTCASKQFDVMVDEARVMYKQHR